MIAALDHTLRDLGRRRLRTGLGVLGIAFTIALLTAIQIGLDSVSSSYTDLVALQAGKADVLITAKGGAWYRPASFARDGVERQLSTHGVLRGLTPRWFGVTRVETAAGSCEAILIGLDPARERVLGTAGLVPELGLGEGVCGISRSLARRLQATAGASVTAHSPSYGPEGRWRVEGVIERQRLLPQEVQDYLVVNEAEARLLLGQTTGVHALAGTLTRAEDYYDARDLHASVLRLKRVGEEMAARLGTGFEVRLPKAAAIVQFEQFSAPLKAVLGVFAVLALVVTGLLVYAVLSVGVEERIRDYAILRTLGGRRRRIFAMVLMEAGLLCGMGVVPGVLSGMGLAQGLVNLAELAWGAGGDVVALRISGATLGWTFVAGVALALGSSWIPAVQAVRWRIVDALDPLRRGQVDVAPPQDTAVNRPLLYAGLALSVLAVVVFFVLPTAVLSGDASVVGSVVLGLLLAVLTGHTLLAVAVLPGIVDGVMRGVGWMFGPAAELARRNLARHRRRNTTTALMFILAVSLVIFVASLVALFSRTVLVLVEHLNGGEVRVQTDLPRAQSLKAELQRVPRVAQVTEVRWLRHRSEEGVAYDVVMSDLVGMKHLWMVPFGVDEDLPGVWFGERVRYEEGGAEAVRALTQYRSDGEGAGGGGEAGEWPPLVLSLSAARYLDVRMGDRVQLTFHLGAVRAAQRFRIVAVCSAVPGLEAFHARTARAVGAGALIPASVLARLTRAAPDDAFLGRAFLRTDGTAGAQEAVARHLREDFDIRYRFGVQTVVERQREARVVYWVTQVLFGLLLGVAVVIAVFALMASMATAVMERRWELGVLKALGLRRSQLFRMFLAEAVGLTLAAGLAGGVIGFGLAYLFVVQAAVLMEIPLVFTLPYVTFVATFGISLLAGAVAALVPTRRMLRLTAAEILRG